MGTRLLLQWLCMHGSLHGGDARAPESDIMHGIWPHSSDVAFNWCFAWVLLSYV